MKFKDLRRLARSYTASRWFDLSPGIGVKADTLGVDIPTTAWGSPALGSLAPFHTLLCGSL